MTSKRYTGKDKNIPQTSYAADNLSMDGKNVTISGWGETETIPLEHTVLIIKKRKTSISRIIPIKLSSETKWKVKYDIEEMQFDKGIWDFYLQNDNKNYRITLDKSVTDHLNGIYKLSGKSFIFTTYRTIKGSLSLKVEPANVTLDNLRFIFDQPSKQIINLRGRVYDDFVSDLPLNNNVKMVVFQRGTHNQIEFPVHLIKSGKQLNFSLDCNYHQLPHYGEIRQEFWDCYIEMPIKDENHLFRIHISEQEDYRQIESESRMEFECPAIFEILFYKTVNNHLSIKQNRVGIHRDVKTISFINGTIRMRGYAYLNTTNVQANQDRRIVIRHRLSRKENIINLTHNASNNEDESREQRYQFDIEVPLQQLPGMTLVEAEIYDIIIRITYRNETYERLMGFEEFTYIKDDVLDNAIIKKNRHYRRMYLGMTPRGNLKMETFYLSKLAYYYLKFIKKIDVFLNKKKDIWLIGERDHTAQDTGFHFFKYCRENHPDLNIYYVINRDSKDVDNLKGLGNVLYTGSLQHIRKASLANTFIGSHDLDNIMPLKGLEFNNFIAGKRVFIQHGVLGRKPVEYDKQFYKYPFDLFCVSSEGEKRVVVNKLGYNPKDVQITGLSRFDQLLNQPIATEQSILLIPTWRDWYGAYINFEETTFYKKYYSLLTNSRLLKILEENDIQLNVYLHYRMQPFIKEFEDINSKVNLIRFEDKNVQQLLMESKLMITDYSSVSFDFNYMSKPVIFYHFDDRLFFKRGILRPKKETFLGDICHYEDQVIQSLEQYVQNGFQEKENIQIKKKQVFSHIDTKNNYRIYEAIKKLSK